MSEHSIADVPAFSPLSIRPVSEEEAAALLEKVPSHLAEELKQLFAVVNEAHENAKDFARTGKWYHVSPHRLPRGTLLVPNGAPRATSADFYEELGTDTGTLADMGADRPLHLWITTTRRDAKFWAETIKAKFCYEVQPTDEPRPWNGTGVDGWVTTSATILRTVRL